MKKYKKQALKVLKGQWKTIITLMFIIILIKLLLIDYAELINIYNNLKNIMDSNSDITTTESRGFDFRQIISYAILPLQIGLMRIYGDISNKEVAKVSDYFYGFRNGKYFSNLGTLLLKSFFIMLWSLLLIIPGIVKIYAYSMTEYIIQDKDFKEKGLDAITKSKNITKGFKFELFVLDLSFIGWYVLLILSLGLLSFYVIPYHNQTRVMLYKEIKDQYFNNVDLIDDIEPDSIKPNSDWYIESSEDV